MRSNVVKEISKSTWEKMKLLGTTNIKINEEGFTQDLIYFLLKNSKTCMIVEKNKKINESKTGADFFWNISIGDKIENFAIQAKRVSLKNSIYNSLFHKVNGISQIELLKRIREYKPMHLFYNSSLKDISFNVNNNCDEEYNQTKNSSLLGITVFPTKYLNSMDKRKKMEDFLKDEKTRSLQQFFREWEKNKKSISYLQFFNSNKKKAKLEVYEKNDYVIYYFSHFNKYEFQNIIEMYEDLKIKYVKSKFELAFEIWQKIFLEIKNNNFKDENYKEFWELNSEIEKLHNSIEEKNEITYKFSNFSKKLENSSIYINRRIYRSIKEIISLLESSSERLMITYI
ncbi:hypothetical protein [Staphylococcus hominis]|uniref:hypothetical protein n=1 Tax=Staphylococcus hominis TaxID=1290 RepID=UPI00066BE3CB|nr:hypothetical protein [Staphylococcus hominis]MCT1483298.1 hypothetical protein [Staphylococcus hominis]